MTEPLYVDFSGANRSSRFENTDIHLCTLGDQWCRSLHLKTEFTRCFEPH